MARPKGTVAGELDIERAQNIPRMVWERAARSVAGELEDLAKRNCSRLNLSGKNPSKPGEYPKLVSGQLVYGIRVVYSRDANELRIYSQAIYGKFLNSGTRKMESRPWALKVLASRDWIKRIAAVARAFNK